MRSAVLILLLLLALVCPLRADLSISYSPYGKVLTAQTIHPHAHPHLGHKALFLDRLDAGIVHPTTADETPRLAVGATVLANNTGRVVHVGLGRFLQGDPNATGLTLIDQVSYGGMGLLTRVNGFDLAGHYGDGAHTYQYLTSNPWTHSDPLGLFIGTYALSYGSRLGELGYDLVSQYSANLESDADWAADWDQSDQGYTRLDNGWIAEIYADHMNAMVRDFAMGPLDDLLDLIELGEDVYDYFTGDDESGPAVGSILSPARRALRNTIRHGGTLHRMVMISGLKWVRGMSVRRADLRMNQALVDPVKGIKLSNMRPDVQGFKRPNTIYIFEAAVSQSKDAARNKWGDEVRRLRQMGYNVIVKAQSSP